MRSVTAAILGATVFLGTAGPTSGGEEGTVEVRDDGFDPATVTGGLAGESVEWEWEEVGEPHNVSQVRGLFRSRRSQDPDFTYVRTFSAGTFPYLCQLHPLFMRGTVKVKPGHGMTGSGLPLMKWASSGTNTGKAFDVQFRIGDGPWRDWKTDTTRLQSAFGRNDRPVPYNEAKEYMFRARSQKRVDLPRAVSKWSPATLYD